MDNCHEPPSKIIAEGIVDIGSADISLDDIKGKRSVGFWDRFIQPALYPAGSSVCTRCYSILMDIQGEQWKTLRNLKAGYSD